MSPILLLALSMATATAQDFPVEFGGEQIATLPQAPRAVVAQGERAWAITEDGRVLSWKKTDAGWVPSPPPAAGPGRAVDLFVAGGQAWLAIEERKAMPIGALPTGGPGGPGGPRVTPTPRATPAPQEQRESGVVLRRAPGTAIIDLGTKADMTVGQAVRFLGNREVEVPSLEGDDTELRTVQQEVATGKVQLVEDDRALVDLDRGGRVLPGDEVERHQPPGSTTIAPKRLGGVGEAGVQVRPLLALETVGVAFINEAWFQWAFEQPWYAEARLAPLGLGWSRDGNPFSAAALGAGGYDGRWFSVGLGAGWSMLNGDPGRSSQYDYAAQDGGGIPDAAQFKSVDNAFAVVQEARLGARDGLHAEVRNTFLLVAQQTWVYDDTCYTDENVDYSDDPCGEWQTGDKEFVFGGIAMRVVAPAGRRTDLVVDWGTGDSGATWAQAGIAAWLKGNGEPGSFGAEIGAGFGSLIGNPDDQEIQLYGPLLSVGARWRL